MTSPIINERTSLVRSSSVFRDESLNEKEILESKSYPHRNRIRNFIDPLYPTKKQSLIRIFCFILGIVISAIIYNVNSIMPHNPPARRALSLFTLAATFWATETLPLYSTSLLIPILIVVMRVLVNPSTGEPFDSPTAAAEVLASMFSKTVLVALGAFTMSLALSKYNLSYRLAVTVLSRVGKKPHHVMLSIMILGLFLSMFMNNVASPVVCVSLVSPMLNELGASEVYSKTLLLGIAYSNNIGGMMSPISSPQNLVAIHTIQKSNWNVTDSDGLVRIEHGKIDWGHWLAISIPFALACTLISWGFLWIIFRPKIKEVNPIPPRKLETFGILHVVVIVVCIATITLWALSSQVEGFFGNNGMVALIPVVIFFTLPILQKSDFKELSWDVLMLLSGGLALGNAIESSGLLSIIADKLSSIVIKSNEWVILMAFSCFIWLFGNFISHTVAAIIVLPVIAQIGCHIGSGDCELGHFRLLVIGSVLVDSGAMGLPVASFPNAQCFSQIDSEGNRYLSALDFVKTGFIIGIIELILMMSLGYGLLRLTV